MISKELSMLISYADANQQGRLHEQLAELCANLTGVFGDCSFDERALRQSIECSFYSEKSFVEAIRKLHALDSTIEIAALRPV